MANIDVDIIKIDTNPAEKNMKSFEQRLKEVTDQMKELASQGDRTSETYKKLAEEAGNLAKAQREVAKDVAEASTTFSNTMQYTAGALSGVSGAVQTVTGVLGLMGVEMGDDTKLMKTLVSAMAITSGVQAVQNGVEAFKMLARNIKTSTVAQKALNMAMNANPVMLLTTAVVALGGAFAGLTLKMNKQRQETEENVKANTKLLDTYRDLQDELIGMSDEIGMESSKWYKNIQEEFLKYNSEANGAGDVLSANLKRYGMEAAKAGDKQKIALLSAVDAYDQVSKALTDYNTAFLTGDQEKIAEKKAYLNKTKKLLLKFYKEATELDKSNPINTPTLEPIDELKKQYDERLAFLKAYYEAGLVDEDDYIKQSIGLYNDYYNDLKNLIPDDTEGKALAVAQTYAILNKEIQKFLDKREEEKKQYEEDTKQAFDARMQSLSDSAVITSAKTEAEILNQINEATIEKRKKLEQDYVVWKLQNELALNKNEQDMLNERLNAGYISMQEYEVEIAKLYRDEAEINKDIQDTITQQTQEAHQKRIEDFTSTASSLLSSTASLLSALQGGINTTTKEGFEKNKQYEIANATISYLQGLISAWASAMKEPSFLSVATATANSALLTGVYTANIAKIKNTKFGDTATGAKTTASNTAVTALQRNYTNARLTDGTGGIYDMNTLADSINEKKVYVSIRDINTAQQQVRVTRQRNTF